MLTSEGCSNRRQRLLRRMEKDRCDLFLTANYRTVYYLTGELVSPDAPAILAMYADGANVLVRPETYSIHRSIDRPMHDAAGQLSDELRTRGAAARCAVERAFTPGLIERTLPDSTAILDATGQLLALRRRKEEDEIAEIRESLRLIGAAYDAARAAIAEGRTELDVYNEMQSAVVQEAGTFVQLHGDFATGERAIRGGGPPTSRVIGKEDLYILDLFPAPHLYFGDTCRTFAAGVPTDEQYRAWEIVCDAVRLGESLVKPGVHARHVYAAIKDFLDSFPIAENSFWHHAGHGIGHHGHEAPRIIPGSDDVFETGDVITLEPGIYTQALHGGIRLEDNYVVRDQGLENLFRYPKEL